MKSAIVLLAFSATACLAQDAPEMPLAYYLDKGYVMATALNTIIVFDAKTPGPAPVVWEWRVDGPYTSTKPNALGVKSFDEVKLRDGGKTMLVSSTQGRWVEIDTETKRILRTGAAYGDSPHSIEKLPDGTIVLARTQPDEYGLKLFWTGEDGKLKSRIDTNCVIDIGNGFIYGVSTQHGVEWDSRRQCLWLQDYGAIGRFAYDPETKSISPLDIWRIGGNHDLSIGDDGLLYNTSSGYRFDPDHGDGSRVYADGSRWYPDQQYFPDLPHYRYDIGENVYVCNANKSLTHDAKYGLVVSPWNDHAHVIRPNGEEYDVYPISENASDMYKIRWVKSSPATWTNAFTLGNTDVSVAADGDAVSATTHLEVTDGKPVLLELSLNGVVVTNWTSNGSGDFVYSSPVLSGTSNVWSVVARTADGATEARRNEGSFLASGGEPWFRVAFSEDSVCPSGSGWIADSTAAQPGGTWSDPGAASWFDSSRRTVVLQEADALSFSPPRAAADTDAEIETCIEIRTLDAPPDAPAASASGFCFVSGAAGIPIPYALGASGWIALPGGGWTPEGDFEYRPVWATLRAEFDFMSSLAPRVRYSLDGRTLSTAAGDEWIALPAGARNVGSVAFRGSGEVGDFSGIRRSRFVEPTFEPPAPSRYGDALSFVGEPGSRTFRITIDNALLGGWYTAFVSPTLDGGFVAERDSVRASSAGDLTLEVGGEEESRFAIVVLSSTPIPAGTPWDAVR